MFKIVFTHVDPEGLTLYINNQYSALWQNQQSFIFLTQTVLVVIGAHCCAHFFIACYAFYEQSERLPLEAVRDIGICFDYVFVQ